MSVRLSAQREMLAIDAIIRAQLGASARGRAFTGINRLSVIPLFREGIGATLCRWGASLLLLNWGS